MAKTYTAKQYKNLKTKYKDIKSQLNDVKNQLATATSSQKVMQGNLDNAMLELNKYRGVNYDYLNKQLNTQEQAMKAAQTAQEENYAYNSAEAEKQRVWQEQMSATAHQREVNDLKAAGLNPVISAYGSGASVGSGAAASASNNLTSALGSIASSAVSAIGSMANAMDSNATSFAQTVWQQAIAARGQDMSYQVQTYATDVASKTNLSMNQATNEMQKYIARVNNLNNKEIAKIAAQANVTSAQVHAAASNYAAEISYAATLKTNATNKEIADLQVNKTFEGLGSTALQKASKGIFDFLKPEKAY